MADTENVLFSWIMLRTRCVRLGTVTITRGVASIGLIPTMVNYHLI